MSAFRVFSGGRLELETEIIEEVFKFTAHHAKNGIDYQLWCGDDLWYQRQPTNEERKP